MKGKTMLLALALVVVLAGGFVLYQNLKDTAALPDPLTTPTSDAGSPTPNRIEAPDFTATDAQGNKVKLSDLRGKPVIINFWATWCGYCTVEMPVFERAYGEYGEDIHFMMLDAVDGVRETRAKGEAYIADGGYTFPVYFDEEQEAVTIYGIRAFPTTAFIDAEGFLVAGIEGALDEARLQRGLEMIFAAAKEAGAGR